MPSAHRIRSTDWRWPTLMAFIRLPMIVAGSGMVVLIYRLMGHGVGIEAGAAWNPLTVTVVNVLCLGLLLWRYRVERLSPMVIMGFRRQWWLRDLAGGLLLSLVLWAMMAVVIVAVVLVAHWNDGSRAFEKAFVGDADFSLRLPMWLAVFSAVVFPIVNAPVEELQYRGYAQPGLIQSSGRTGFGIVVPAIGFGLQHAAFALTVTAALAYVAGFFVWGLGAGLVVHRQKRLAPIIIAHFLSNLSFGFLPLVFVLAERSGG